MYVRRFSVCTFVRVVAIVYWALTHSLVVIYYSGTERDTCLVMHSHIHTLFIRMNS